MTKDLGVAPSSRSRATQASPEAPKTGLRHPVSTPNARASSHQHLWGVPHRLWGEKVLEFGRQIEGDYAEGASIRELARHHGCSPTKIKTALKACGVALRSSSETHRRGHRDPSRALDFKRRYEGGDSFQDIARAYGISRERVRQVLKVEGIVGWNRHLSTVPDEVLTAELEQRGFLVSRRDNGSRPKGRDRNGLGGEAPAEWPREDAASPKTSSTSQSS